MNDDPRDISDHLSVLRDQLRLVEELESGVRAEYLRATRHRSGVRSVAAIRNELFEVQRLIADKRVALAQIEGVEAQSRAAEQLAHRQAEREDAAFWLRRFILSLALGNGAAFAALASGALQNDTPERAVSLVAMPLHAFGVGLIVAGAIPALVWLLSVVRNVLSALFARFPEDLFPKRFRNLMRWVYIEVSPRYVGFLATSAALASAMLFVQGVYASVNVAYGPESGLTQSQFFFLDPKGPKVITLPAP